MAKEVSRVFQGVINDDSIFFQFDCFYDDIKGKLELEFSKYHLNGENLIDVLNEKIEKCLNASKEDMDNIMGKDDKRYLDSEGNEIEFIHEIEE